VAERLRQQLEQHPIAVEDHRVAVTASLGVASREQIEAHTLEELIEYADKALLVAKKTGKNRVVNWHANLDTGSIHDPMADIQRSYIQRLETLVRVAARINMHLDLQTVLRHVCRETVHALQVPLGVAYTVDPQTALLQPLAVSDALSEYQEHMPALPQAFYTDLVRERNSEIIVISDLRILETPYHPHLPTELDPCTAVVAPIIFDHTLIGLLLIATCVSQRQFNAEELALVQGLADLAAIAAHNATRFAELMHNSITTPSVPSSL
jgi:transcriptional regulator with GAF, ATPase, and Fis domain